MPQSPIFTKYRDLMVWLILQTISFPKSQRGVMAREIQANLFANHKLLIRAGRSKAAMPLLDEFDTGLVELRSLLQVSFGLRLFSVGQYEHVSRMVNEVGRLLGGWKGRELEDMKRRTS